MGRCLFLLIYLASACGQFEKSESKRFGEFPAAANELDVKAQEFSLLIPPGTTRTSCWINLESSIPAHAKVPCRGSVLSNWMEDSYRLSGISAARCAQRAAEWAHYCGVIRTTSVLYGQNSNGTYYPIRSTNRQYFGLPIGGIYNRLRASYEYFLAD